MLLRVQNIKLISFNRLPTSVLAHTKRKRDFSVSVQIFSNNPSSWFSSDDKAEASFTQSDGTAVLDIMSYLKFVVFVCFSFVVCEYKL